MKRLFQRQQQLSMVFQSEINECGLACLAMVSNYYGNMVELSSLRTLLGQTLTGASVNMLRRCARELKLTSRALKLELDELKQLERPAILHWDMDHFVVLQGVTRKYIQIHDPAVGIRRYTWSELDRHFSGIALELQPDQDFCADRNDNKLKLGDLLSPGQRLKTQVIQIAGLSLLIQFLILTSPLYLQLVIDQGVGKGDMDLIFGLALVFVLLVAMRVLLNYARAVLTMGCTNNLGFQLVSDTFNHLLRLSMNYFEKRELGDITSRFNALESIKQIVTQEMVTILIDGVFSIVTLLLLFFYSPLMATQVLFAVCLFAVLRLMTLSAERNRRQEVVVLNASQQSRFMENVRSIRTIKVNDLESDRVADWEQRYANYVNAGFQLGRFQEKIAGWQGLILGVENILTIYVGSLWVYQSQLTLGQFMSFILLKQHFINSVSALLPKLSELKLMQLELDRVADIRRHPASQARNSQSLIQHTLEYPVEFCELTFAFTNQEQPLIDKLSVTVPQGNLCVITGPSGCGKTTLLKLLLGLETASSGHIQIGTQRLATPQSMPIQGAFSAVLHDEGLLSGDLAYNINLGVAPHDQERLNEACAKAGLTKIVESLQLGFATRIGELGNILSAGQVKRVLLARAFYRRPKLLVLDETLTHLGDKDTWHVLESIRSAGITAIITSHDHQIISQADQVISMPNDRAGTGQDHQSKT